MNVTLRVFFRNIMLFVQYMDGTDVWLVDGHKAYLATAGHVLRLHKNAVRILSDGKELGPVRTVLGPEKLIPDFRKMDPRVNLHEHIKGNVLSDKRLGKVALRGNGTLRGLPSAHSHGALLEWTIPTVSGDPLKQRMTEVALYEVKDVATPVVLSIEGATSEKVEVKPSKDENDRDVVDVFVMAGEKLERRALDDRYKIDEYDRLHVCFDSESAARLKDLFPSAEKPKGAVDGIRTADPFCPNGRAEMLDLETPKDSLRIEGGD